MSSRKKHDEPGAGAAREREGNAPSPLSPPLPPLIDDDDGERAPWEEPVTRMAPDLAAESTMEDRDLDRALRPKTFAEYIGQKSLLENLRVMVAAAKKRRDAMDHVLFFGPPGLGKTTLAGVLAHELGVGYRAASGPAIEHKGILASHVVSLAGRDVFFIDEIHRLPAVVQESLYPAMEDFRFDIAMGNTTSALPIAPFTLAAATTRTGLLSAPLLDRFGYVGRLQFYTGDDLATIVGRSSRILGVAIDDAAAFEIGGRSRGTPRIANRLLRRVRDYADVENQGRITLGLASDALTRLGVDKAGLQEGDRMLLRAMIVRFQGGPVGVESLAAALAEERDTIEDYYEPYLIQEGYVTRTPRGRVALRRAYEHLGLPMIEGNVQRPGQLSLPE